MTQRHTLAVGDKVRVVAKHNGNQFELGEVVTYDGDRTRFRSADGKTWHLEPSEWERVVSESEIQHLKTEVANLRSEAEAGRGHIESLVSENSRLVRERDAFRDALQTEQDRLQAARAKAEKRAAQFEAGYEAEKAAHQRTAKVLRYAVRLIPLDVAPQVRGYEDGLKDAPNSAGVEPTPF